MVEGKQRHYFGSCPRSCPALETSVLLSGNASHPHGASLVWARGGEAKVTGHHCGTCMLVYHFTGQIFDPQSVPDSRPVKIYRHNLQPQGGHPSAYVHFSIIMSVHNNDMTGPSHCIWPICGHSLSLNY